MKTITITEEQLAEACAKAINRTYQKAHLSNNEILCALLLSVELREQLFKKESEEDMVETEDDISEVLE